MIEREQILTCSIFDTIRLFGSTTSPFHEKVIIILHKTENELYGVTQDKNERITFDETFDSSITHFEYVTNIKESHIVVEEVIREKKDGDVLYLDETVYSELFNYLSEHAKYSELSLEKREHMTNVLFHLLKWYQDRDDTLGWQKGVRPQQPLHVRLTDTNGFVYHRFARPIVNVEKDKLKGLNMIDFLDNVQAPLEHVCPTIPKLKNSVQYIRTYKDENHNQTNVEFVVREPLDYGLRNNPLEHNFQYKNMYKAGKHTACSSQGGNDRLYYTDLSTKQKSTKQETTNEIEFARVLYYPYIRKYEDINEPIQVDEYSFVEPDDSDNVFHQRFTETYFNLSKNIQYLVHPLRQRFVTLTSTIKSCRDSNRSSDLTNMLNGKKLHDIVSTSHVLKRHAREIRRFSSMSQWETLLSRYNIESNVTLSENDWKMLYKSIRTSVKLVADIFDLSRTECANTIESLSTYRSVMGDTTKTFMSLIQNKSPYVDINKALSKSSSILRELKASSNGRLDYGVDPEHIYAWLYTSLCQAHEYSSYFDHIYGDIQQPKRSNETLSSLVQTVLAVYGFQDTSAPIPSQGVRSKNTTLSACDVRNMKALHTLTMSSDSGKLFTGLLKSRHDFEYIVRLKDKLLEYGKKRFEHTHKSASTDNSQEETSESSWDDLSEEEKLQYSPNKLYVQNLFKTIVQPLLKTFRSAPRGLCSGHAVVKVYSSAEEMQQDITSPRTDTDTTFSKSVMRTLQSLLEGKQGNETLIDDKLFDQLYYDITNKDRMRVRQSRLIRPGEYASVKNMNVLYQWTGNSWLKEEIDFQNEMNQCPYNFSSINEIDWESLIQERDNMHEISLDALCVYEERLQECLPYPLYRLFQFVVKIYGRYLEIASNILNIETKYSNIIASMQAAVLQNPQKRQTFHKKQTTLKGAQREPMSEAINDILRRILNSDVFSDSQLHACNDFVGFVHAHRDKNRTSDDGFVYWNFSHNRVCGHWLTFAGSFVQNPSLVHSSSADERREMLHTLFTKWPCDRHGYCTHCGTSMSSFKDVLGGTEWEQIHDGKEAVAMPQRQIVPVQSLETVLDVMSPEDMDMKRKIEAFVDMFRNTMGLSKVSENFSILCTNMIIPRVTVQSYNTFAQNLIASDPKLEKRKATIEKDRVKYAKQAGADVEFFRRDDRSLLAFFKRQAPREKPKKQKRIHKNIQALEWLESYYHNYVEEQHVMAVLGAFYIYICLQTPSMTIRKKDSMSDVRISIRTLNDLVTKQYAFVKTMTVFLQKLLMTPANLSWPSERTRQRMRAKIKQEIAQGTPRDTASYTAYGATIISYLEQLQTIYPYYESLKEKKTKEEEKLQKNETKSLSSYRPIYDRSQLAYSDSTNALMTLIEKTLNSADVVPYNTTSCVFPYIQDADITHPYIYSLVGRVPEVLLSKNAEKTNAHRRLFVPLKYDSMTPKPYLHLDDHDPSYVESRFTTFMQKYTSSGEKRTYRPIPISDSLRHLTQYKDFLDNDPLASSYHPAVVRALEENENEIHRDLQYRDGAQFKTNDALAKSDDLFHERIMAWRKNQICETEPEKVKNKKRLSFQEQFHEICTLWKDVDNSVLSTLRLESMVDKSFFEVSKNSQGNTGRQAMIARLERIIENECKRAGGLQDLRRMIRPSEVDGGHILKLGQLLACISAYLSSTIHGCWTSLLHRYEPASGKNVDSFLQQELLEMRTLHTSTFEINRHTVNRLEQMHVNLAETGKSRMLQPISGAVREIQSMHVIDFDEEERRYMYLLCLYIIVNQITTVRTSVSSPTAHALVQTILQFIRESDMIESLGTSDVQEMQQYIDQKNNASRVRFIERLKVIDPALENSHYMFRRNNLGKVAHVDFTDIDEKENDVMNTPLDDTTWMEISNEEEGYTTLMEEE